MFYLKLFIILFLKYKKGAAKKENHQMSEVKE